MCFHVSGVDSDAFSVALSLRSLPPLPPLSSHPPESSNNANSSPSRCPDTVSTGSRKRGNVADKGPRVRTVLSEQQLQTLRTVYASNPRPDALLKEHLVELTGLNPRVIRVWFQNKRCKDKKRSIQAEALARQQQQVQTSKTPQVGFYGDKLECSLLLFAAGTDSTFDPSGPAHPRFPGPDLSPISGSYGSISVSSVLLRHQQQTCRLPHRLPPEHVCLGLSP